MTAGSGKSRDLDLLAGVRLADTPGHLLRRNHQRSYEIFSRLVGDDVTRQQMALLISLHQTPGASQRTLVELTGFDRATIAEMVGRMIERGWVERRRDQNDGRAWTMNITDAGRDVVLERIRQTVAVQEEILAPLPEPDREHFLRCLRILLGLQP